MDKVQKAYIILLFFFSPFLGIINVFKQKNEKEITFFVTLFFGLLGSVFIYNRGTDGYSQLMNAKEVYLNMTFVEFLNQLYTIITFSAVKGTTDLYLHCISFLSASVLQTPELIHVFAGFVLGYFFIKSVLLVLKNNLHTKKNYILLGFITLFLLIKSIEALNSIRMWTGMWVFFYGTYSYATTKEKKYVSVILFAVFVHFSYAVILIPVLLAYLLQSRKKILVALYVISFFSTLGFTFFEAYIPKLDLLENKQKAYAIDSDDKVKRFAKDAANYQEQLAGANFYKTFGISNYIYYSIVGLSFVLIYFYLRKSSTPNFNFLLATGIGLYTFGNLVEFSPELSGRSKIIASTFILAAAIHLQLTLKNYYLSGKATRYLNDGLILFLLSSIPIFLFQVADIFFNISFFIFLLPPISWILGDGDYSIRAVLGLLLGLD